MTATTETVFSPTRRFLPLWAPQRRRDGQRTGRMHLARLKSTKQPVTTSWCGRVLYVDRTGPRSVTGEEAVLIAWADEQPTCHACLARVGAWEWEW